MLKIRQLFMLFFAVAVSLFAADWSKLERDALKQAIDDAVKSVDLNKEVLRNKNILMMPLYGDQGGFVFTELKTKLVTGEKLTVVEEKDSAALDAIAKEFAWDERMKDIMLPESLVKFGNLLGAQVIVYGRIREVSTNLNRIYAELELFATQIETRKVLWGGKFVGSIVPLGNLRGGFSANPHVVFGLKQAFKLFSESLSHSNNLETICSSSVVTLDLAGDIDKYVGKRTYELLTENRITPRELGFSTLTQARAYIRDNKLKADAYLYGAIRAMYSQEEPGQPENKKTDLKTQTTTIHHPVFIEIELRIVDAKNEDILWAKSVAESFDDVETRPATKREIAIEKKIQDEVGEILDGDLKNKSEAEKQQKIDELRRQRIAEEEEKERLAKESAQNEEAAKKAAAEASQGRLVKGILWGIGGIAALALVLFILRGMMSNVKIR